MTRTFFTVIFMLVTAGILLAIAPFAWFDQLAKFSFILILAGFYIGQYSMRFPKNKL